MPMPVYSYLYDMDKYVWEIYNNNNKFSHYRIFFDNIRITDDHFVPDHPEEAAERQRRK